MLERFTQAQKDEVFSSPDDLKLRSSMTLFDIIEPFSIFHQVLEKFFDGKRDSRTLKILHDQQPTLKRQSPEA